MVKVHLIDKPNSHYGCGNVAVYDAMFKMGIKQVCNMLKNWVLNKNGCTILYSVRLLPHHATW